MQDQTLLPSASYHQPEQKIVSEETASEVDVQQVITEIVEKVLETRCEKMENLFEKRFKEIDLRICQNSLKLDQILKILSTTEARNMPLEVDLELESHKNTLDFKFPITNPDEILELELKLSRDPKFKILLVGITGFLH